MVNSMSSEGSGMNEAPKRVADSSLVAALIGVDAGRIAGAVGSPDGRWRATLTTGETVDVADFDLAVAAEAAGEPLEFAVEVVRATSSDLVVQTVGGEWRRLPYAERAFGPMGRVTGVAESRVNGADTTAGDGLGRRLMHAVADHEHEQEALAAGWDSISYETNEHGESFTVYATDDGREAITGRIFS